MSGDKSLQPLVDDINRRLHLDAVLNLLSDICDERDAADLIVWSLVEVVSPEVAKRLLRVLHHLDEIERIVDLRDQHREET